MEYDFIKKERKHNTLVFSIFLLVILVIILVYTLVSLNIKYNDTVAALNQRIQVLEQQTASQLPEKTIVEYVCVDGRTVTSADQCVNIVPQTIPPKIEEPEVNIPEITIKPILTNEAGTRTTNVSINPACINGYNGGTIYYDTNLKPLNVTLQFRDVSANADYKIAKVYSSETQKYRYFSICDDNDLKCLHAGDFYLKKGDYHFIRLVLNHESTVGKIDYSNEYIVDARPGSRYTSTVCRN